VRQGTSYALNVQHICSVCKNTCGTVFRQFPSFPLIVGVETELGENTNTSSFDYTRIVKRYVFIQLSFCRGKVAFS
jgi:hypothetical protein